jgi:hypothetical protein
VGVLGANRITFPSTSPSILANPLSASQAVFGVQAASGQTAPLMVLLDPAGNVLGQHNADGSWSPPTLADAAAPAGSVYLGSDHLDGAGAPKLCRKSSAGIVTVLG